ALPEVGIAAAAPGDHAAVLLEGEAVPGTSRDRGHTARRRGRDAALPEVLDAAPGDHAAVLLQGEAVADAGGDRCHAARRRGWDGALAEVGAAAQATTVPVAVAWAAPGAKSSPTLNTASAQNRRSGFCLVDKLISRSFLPP